jgi:hypothetical protein
MMFTLVVAVLFPLVNSQTNHPTSPLPLDNLNWWNTSWPYRKLITIDHTKVDSSLSNFPVIISIASDSDLANKAQDDGNDIVFVPSSDNTIKLNHEIESYNGDIGMLYAWVNITSLSSTTNTKIWMYYGNADSGSQQNKYGTWNSKYKAVYHLDENEPPYVDSTSNKNNITTANVNGTGMVQTGGIYKWQHFNGTSNRFVIPFSLSGAYTLEAIANTDSMTSSEVLIGYGLTTSSPYPGVAMGISSTSDAIFIGNGNLPKGLSPITTYVTEKTTHWWSDVYRSNTSLRFYLDGINYTSSLSNMNYFNDADGYCTIGARFTSGSYGLFWKGYIDEVRISNGTWNASWMKTCYNNQNNPESFYSIGAEQIQLPNPPPFTGPSWGLINVDYTFCVTVTNPNGDNLYCIWDWGDGTISDWLGPYSSGEMVYASHPWSQKGTYGIRVKLKDVYGQESGWSNPQIITIYELKQAIIFGSYANKITDDGFISIHAVNLRMILLKPFQFDHYVQGENITFSNTFKGLLMKQLIIGEFDIVK